MELSLPPLIEKRNRKTGRFEKGIVPFNKGKKGLMGANKTSFKKGHTPKNTKPIGTVSERADSYGRTYLYIKISAHKWELFHVNIWKKQNREVPPKHIITFKDKNPFNCRIENLECISMAENMKRNMNENKRLNTFKSNHRRKKLREKYSLNEI